MSNVGIRLAGHSAAVGSTGQAAVRTGQIIVNRTRSRNGGTFDQLLSAAVEGLTDLPGEEQSAGIIVNALFFYSTQKGGNNNLYMNSRHGHVVDE